MVFSSITFMLYFLPLVLGLNFLLPRSWRNYWLLLCSLFFYAWGAPQFVFLLAGSIVVNFGLVRVLHHSADQKVKKRLLGLSLFLNIGLLAYFKYANFFVENVHSLLSSFGFEAGQWIDVALPIGISFFTFQSLTYSLDVYRKTHDPLKRLGDYALYILLFPQMIAGPIVRFHTIADDLVERVVRHEDFRHGIHRFIIGLTKKVLIANTLAELAPEELLGSGESINSTGAWLGILAYTFQIYFDFSGYSDMAIGLGRMMGFRFPENFNNPYTSKSITEFWQRWHITLGVWMRDYLYIPLGGNRVKTQGRLYFNLIFVFLVSGLWHGASWNFVIWGGYHGVFLMLERLFLAKALSKVPSIVSVIYTFLVVMIGWVFFSIESFDMAIAYIQQLFAFDFGQSPWLYDHKVLITFAVAEIFAFFTLFPKAKGIQEWFFDVKVGFGSNTTMNLITVVLLVYSIMHLVGSDFNPFIYFRF